MINIQQSQQISLSFNENQSEPMVKIVCVIALGLAAYGNCVLDSFEHVAVISNMIGKRSF